MEEARNSRSEHDNYSFAPVSGEYNGVRTFAQEVKHVATANLVFYSAIRSRPRIRAGDKRGASGRCNLSERLTL